MPALSEFSTSTAIIQGIYAQSVGMTVNGMSKCLRLYLLVFFTMLPSIGLSIPSGTLDSGNRFDYVGLVFDGANWGSGVLLNPNVVLTAGHVVETLGSGLNFYTWDGVGESFQGPVSVGSTIVHPLYQLGNFATWQYDLALLFLSSPVAASQYAALNPAAMSDLVGVNVNATGFGGTLERRFATETIESVTAQMLITESPGPFTEPGDSGGGLFTELLGFDLLAGVTSWLASGTDGYVSGFASVSHSRDFLERNVDGLTWFGEGGKISVAPSVLLIGVGLMFLTRSRRGGFRGRANA